MNFTQFKQAVAQQFARMQKYPLFRTAVTGDELWQTYLESFPEGSNPIYRKRTEHDCSCCRQFIRTIGNVVAITENGLQSIWGVMVDDSNYQVVADALEAKVVSAPITDFFMHYDKSVGTDKNFEQLLNGDIQQWNHFHVTLPPNVVKPKDRIPSLLGELRGKHDVFKRALDTISFEAVDTVLELIAQNSLYRGEEHKFAVSTFRGLKASYAALPEARRDQYVWVNCNVVAPAVASIRNTVIGTLLVDLSEGVPLEVAVKTFESKVAPANYKRPTALVTQRMIDDAKKTVEELGLTSALQRRYARLDDITINNVLFADRSIKKQLGGDVFGDLAASTAVKSSTFDKIEEVPVKKFIEDVLPTAKSIEALVENTHAGNFVSLIAPVDPTATSLFKWGNNFSWSYTGDVTDSIKERVKAAGGNVTGDVCCRLAWHNSDDLDFHMLEPDGEHIYFGRYRREKSPSGGMLDIDMNGCDRHDDENPVENIFYETTARMEAGRYELKVHCYSKRNTDPERQGFEVEIEIRGEKYSLAYDKPTKRGEKITVAEIDYDGKNFTVVGTLTNSVRSRDVWGVKTQTFVPVKAVMLSPNHWDGEVGAGNKHYFFMLDGCANDGTARGFYNEFLNSELDKHRKVMELVGSKLKTETSEHQLSGLGFSTTQRASLVCRVDGAFSRVIRIIF